MGGKARPKPKRLAEKLLQVRLGLGLSQNELIKRLGVALTQNRISDYELDRGEPPLPLLLAYARLAGVCVDVLIDDELNLPAKMPAQPKHTRG
jgi:transcriptional regulator with XRE-family HTH domain